MAISWIVGWGVAAVGAGALLLLSRLYWRSRSARHRDAARRAHEFEILTHIGTTLSSSLDPGGLLAAIHQQLRKLMDVRNFYVAFLDEAAGEVRFAFEVEDGERRAPRSRPRAQALTERIIATGQPLLIAGDIQAYCQRHGLVRSGRPARNYLGVPVILKGRPRGVIAVQSPDRDDAYDQEHLRILEILAGQAAVALDNASLFAEVQRDARQKAFLNHIARLTHATLSPPEMLASVVREIASVFGYPFVSASLPRFGDTPPDGDDFEVCTTAGVPTPGLCGLCLPLRIGGQTLGRLYLEAQAPSGFSPDQFMVLATLSDQLAAALNHANLFLQVQQQAITDSLTGLKTRRFFMEALHAEWRRARNAGDSFCVVLLDLDGFKPLNDTHGHIEGDRVLVRVARILEKKCRASSVVARYGGDEFVVLVPACDPEVARQLPRRLAAALADDPLIAQRGLQGSFGLAVYPDSGANPEELLRHADDDMYRAKQLRNPVRR